MSSPVPYDEDLSRVNGQLHFDPYNPVNIQLEVADVYAILTQFGLPPRVNNIEIYRRAFIHKSYIKRPAYENAKNGIVIASRPPNCLPLHTKSNERLEFLGDAILCLSAKTLLYMRFPHEQEGFMTKTYIELIKNVHIGKLVMEMGLPKFIHMSRHSEELGVRGNKKHLGCIFESLLGAIYLDFNKVDARDIGVDLEPELTLGPGFQMCHKFITNVFNAHVNWVEIIENDNNFKSRLQEKCQQNFRVTPHYLGTSGPVTAADGVYKMGVYLCIGQPIHSVNMHDAIPVQQFASIDAMRSYIATHGGRLFCLLGEGAHRSKKVAEQKACEMALESFS